MSSRDTHARPSPSVDVPENAIETEVCVTWLEEDGILHTILKPGCVIGLDEAKGIWDAQTRALGDRARLSYVDITGIEHATREARQYLGGHSEEELPVAMALLIGSSISRVIGNFFLGLNKPSFPTRLFTDEGEALEWLRSLAAKPPPRAGRELGA